MKLVRWKRFTWDLSKLPPAEAGVPPHYLIRQAGREDHKAAREVIFNAFTADSTWSDTFKSFSGKLEAQIEATFSRAPGNALVVSHGQRIIGASLLTVEPEAENHLLSGPCVLSEYRSRGIGTALVYQSLKLLQGAGLPRAYGVCKEMAPASKFVYRKFGSTNEPYDFDARPLEAR